MPLTRSQIQQFKIDGYLVLPALLSNTETDKIRQLTREHCQKRREPFELEAQLKYPGAPNNVQSEGGETIRRLLQAFKRDELLAQQACKPEITTGIKQILEADELWLNPNHHNCIMTKQPAFSSETQWHRDTRYWEFSDKYLVNAWFAIGDELEENGAMKILPGSHRWDVLDQALDDAQFLKLDHPDNQDRLATQRLVTLNQGDVLLFSAHCFHAAGRNITTQAKFSLVFTYHGHSTIPLHGSQSALQPEIKI
jgi:phytanoyl-CoA hydroxylase